MGLPPGVPCTPYFSGTPLQPVFLCCQEGMDEGLRGTWEAWGSQGLFLGPPNLLPRGGLLTRHISPSSPGARPHPWSRNLACGVADSGVTPHIQPSCPF